MIKPLRYLLSTASNRLIAEFGEFFFDGLEFREALGFSLQVDLGFLSLVEGLGSNLPLLFQLVNQGLLLPANFGAEVAQIAPLSVVLQSEDSQSFRHNLLLRQVVGSGASFEHL